jgi:hypothetical protein
MSASPLYRHRAPALALLAGLAACTGQQSTTGGGLVPNAAGVERLAPAGDSARVDSFQPNAGIRIFTANRDNASVLGFSVRAAGDVKPTRLPSITPATSTPLTMAEIRSPFSPRTPPATSSPRE